jgi:L-threonylcarbamoyladenylate synthase
VDAQNLPAVRKLFNLKKRSREKALPIMIASLNRVDSVAQNISSTARDLMNRYWPGALTIVLQKSPTISYLITSGKNTVAIRIPDHPIALGILRKYENPLAVTSANISGKSETISAGAVAKEFGDKVDLIIPGEVKFGIVSTVVDCTVEPPIILRNGVLELSDLLEKLA